MTMKSIYALLAMVIATLAAGCSCDNNLAGPEKPQPSRNGKGTVRINAVSHEIVSPRDAASGLPTGKQ